MSQSTECFKECVCRSAGGPQVVVAPHFMMRKLGWVSFQDCRLAAPARSAGWVGPPPPLSPLVVESSSLSGRVLLIRKAPAKS